jgi:hypothetical protein
MTDKTSFSAEEWAGVLQLPGAVSMYIITASPAIGDSVKETFSLAQNLADPKQKENAGGLLKAVLEEFKDAGSARQAQPKLESAQDMAALRTTLLENIRKNTAVVDQKAEANEAIDFKMWLYKVANDTAQAAKEGDFLGIGGQKVNDAETAALTELGTIFGVQQV